MLLKQPELESLRNRLLKTALDFYKRLRGTLDSDHDADPKAHEALSDACHRVAHITYTIGSKEDALAAFEQSRAIEEGLLKAGPADEGIRLKLAGDLNQIGDLQRTFDRPDEAVKTHQEALTLCKELDRARPGSPKVRNVLGWVWYCLGLAQRKCGDKEGALRSLRESLAVRDELARSDPEDLNYQGDLGGELYLDLSIMLEETGRHVEAIEGAQEDTGHQRGTRPGSPRQRTGPPPPVRGVQRPRQSSPKWRLPRGRGDDVVPEVAGHPGASGPRPPHGDRVSDRLGQRAPQRRPGRRQRRALGRALRRFRQCRVIREDQVRANPSVPEYRHGLAEVNFSIAYVSLRRRRPDEAMQRLPDGPVPLPGPCPDEAEPARLPVEAWGHSWEHRALVPGDRSPGRGPAFVPGGAGELRSAASERTPRSRATGAVWPTGRQSSRICSQRRDGRTKRSNCTAGPWPFMRKGSEGTPSSTPSRSIFPVASCDFADLLVACGRTDEAIPVIEMARQSLEGRPKTDARTIELLSVYHFVIGDVRGTGSATRPRRKSLEQARSLIEARPRLTSFHHYRLARVYAQLSALADQRRSASDEGRSLADRAVDELHRALDATFEDAWRIKTEPDFDPLRSRPDFQGVMADLAFPEWPFAVDQELTQPAS